MTTKILKKPKLKNHHPVAHGSGDKHAEPGGETPIMVYEQTENASTFMTPNVGGPAWENVVRRITKVSTTGEILADEEVTSNMQVYEIHRKLPNGRTDIIMEFHYKQPEKGKHRPYVTAFWGDPDVYEVPGGHMVHGRFVSYYKGTKRPLNLWPELWAAMAPKQKNLAVKKWEDQVKNYDPEAAEQAKAEDIIRGEACAAMEGDIPSMPTIRKDGKHREKNVVENPLYNACVARPVEKSEIAQTKAAQDALDKEWDKLLKIGTWDESKVQEWSHVAARHRKDGTKAHIGRVFEICVEKGSELPPGHPDRKFKGRSVYQGNQVRDAYGLQAVFEDLGSSPAAMESGKLLDGYGLLEGHDCQIADAIQAYVQTTLKCKAEAWVRLPKNRQPKGWANISDPVVPLKLALYGHPESGGWWERHLESHLVAKGWKAVPEWRSTYFHPEWKTLLAVYVDDFKMSGPSKNLSAAWSSIRKDDKMKDPMPTGKYLGCSHRVYDANIKDGGVPVHDEVPKGTPGSVRVRVLEYDVSAFFKVASKDIRNSLVKRGKDFQWWKRLS